jgi:hypothetical protein
LALFAATAAGCGGGGKSSQETPAASSQSSSSGSSSATAWAASFCGYAKTWQTSLRQAGATLKSNSTCKAVFGKA